MKDEDVGADIKRIYALYDSLSRACDGIEVTEMLTATALLAASAAVLCGLTKTSFLEYVGKMFDHEQAQAAWEAAGDAAKAN